MTTSAFVAAEGTGAARAPLPPHTTMSYRLTSADALAWERRDPVARKKNRVALGGAVFAGIGLLSVTARHLPVWLSSLHSNALAVLILCLPLGLVLLVQRIDLRQRARRRVPMPTDVKLELWDRRLSECRDDRPEALVLGAQTLRAVIGTQEHVFLHARSGTVIVPASAFADAGAKDAFVDHWEQVTG